MGVIVRPRRGQNTLLKFPWRYRAQGSCRRYDNVITELIPP